MAESKKQMLINYVPGEECRVALVENGRLEEFQTERAGAISYVGNIYIGKVTNVEASIQAAFVDFGHDTNGFLHVSDVHPRYFPGGDDDTTERIGRKTPRRERPPIQKCLKRGQSVLVQVIKEGINTKGPTLSSYISIPGRCLVMLPDMDRVGVSRKVEDDDERRSMRKVLDSLELPKGFGFILRTAGEGKGKTELKRDLAYLQRLWKDIERRRSGTREPRLLYAESDLLMRALRDVWTSEINEIIIDNEAALRRADRFMRIVSPRTSTRLLQYDRGTPLFHAFGVEEQIASIHAREVPLPSGGSLVIDETEAMIAIDVNSGKMRKHGDAETTAYKTNVEAVDEICRQLRLRDVGGLVMCDLIDMMNRTNRRKIEQQFRDRLKTDRAASKTLPVSQFGIVEMTRQRQKQSVRGMHYASCPECSGRGVLKRPDSVADDALRELHALLDHARVAEVEIVVSPRVAGALLSKRRQTLSRIEMQLDKTVDVRVSEDIASDRVNFYAYDSSGADIDQSRLPETRPPTDLPEWTEHAKAGADWTVDTTREELELEIEALEEDDPILDALELEDDGAGEEPDPVSSKKKRRRRRRGGRGRGRRKAQPADAGEEATHAGGAPDDTSVAPESRGVEQEPSDEPLPLRGDSWDLEPAALTARADDSDTPAAKDEQVSSTSRPARKGRRRRGRRGGTKASEPTTAESLEAEPSSLDEEPAPQDERAASPAQKKRRTRKKTSSKKKRATTRKATRKKVRRTKKKQEPVEKRGTDAPARSAAPDTPAESAPDGDQLGENARPRKRLYGSRKRLKPGATASIARED